MNAVYTRYEMLRLVRNKRAFIFSLIFPVLLFVMIAGSNKDQTVRRRRRHHLVPHVLHGQHRGLRSDDRGDLGRRRASRPNAGPDGIANCASLRCRSGTTSRQRSSPRTQWHWPASPCCSRPASPTASASPRSDAGSEMTALLIIGLMPFVAMGIAIGHLLDDRRDGSGCRCELRLVRLPRRPVVPAARSWCSARHRPMSAVVLADSRQPDRRRRAGVGLVGVDRGRNLVGCDDAARRMGVPPRHPKV